MTYYIIFRYKSSLWNKIFDWWYCRFL